MSTNTTHYNLIKPESTDAISPTSFNQNMDTLDALLYTIAGSVGSFMLLKSATITKSTASSLNETIFNISNSVYDELLVIARINGSIVYSAGSSNTNGSIALNTSEGTYNTHTFLRWNSGDLPSGYSQRTISVTDHIGKVYAFRDYKAYDGTSHYSFRDLVDANTMILQNTNGSFQGTIDYKIYGRIVGPSPFSNV